MSCRFEEAKNRSYKFCPDDEASPANYIRAVARAHVIDEITNQPPKGELTVTSLTNGLSPRVGRDGLVGLVGTPARIFSSLDVASVDVRFSINSSRYLPLQLGSPLGPIPGYPQEFEPIDFGIVSFHREPIILRGRVVQRDQVGSVPLAGVTVSIIGIWETLPGPHDDVETVMNPPNIIGINPGLYTSQIPAITSVRRRDLVPAVGEDKHLVLPVQRGSQTLILSNQVNLNVGDILAIDIEDKWITEFLQIFSIESSSNADQPAKVTLANPVAHYHRQETICTRTFPQAAGANNTVTRQGIPGDRIIFLDTMQDLDGAAVVEITGGVATEYHRVHRYRTESGPGGYFRLPPISRLAQVRLEAKRLDLGTPVEITMSPDYRHTENWIDLVFP